MLKVVEKNTPCYLYKINGHDLQLDKTMVDKYSEIVCPVDERYMTYMVNTFDKDNCKDSVLSCKIALDMTRELSGYER